MMSEKRRPRSRPPIFTEKEERQLVHYMNARSAMENGISRARMRRIAYQYAVAKKLRYPLSWDETEHAGLTWLRGFTIKNRRKLMIKPHELLEARQKVEAGCKSTDSSFDEDEDLEGFDPFEDIVVMNDNGNNEDEVNEDGDDDAPPGKKRRVVNKKKVDKAVILLAIEDVTNKRLSLREAARIYDIALTTLHLHLRTYRSVGGCPEAYLNAMMEKRRGFSTQDELAIVEHVNRCADEDDLVCSRLSVRKLIYEFVQSQGIKYPKSWKDRQMASTKWLLGFVARHADKLKLDEAALRVGELVVKDRASNNGEDALLLNVEDEDSCSNSNEYVDGINDSYLMNDDEASESFLFNCPDNEEKGVAIEEEVVVDAPSQSNDDEEIIENVDVMENDEHVEENVEVDKEKEKEVEAEEEDAGKEEEKMVVEENEEITRSDREEAKNDKVERVRMVRTFYHFPDMIYETFEPVPDVKDCSPSDCSDDCIDDGQEDRLLEDSINDNYIEITNEDKTEINANNDECTKDNDIEIINISSPEKSTKIFSDEEESQLVEYINLAISSLESKLLITMKQAKKLTYEYATKQIRKYSRVYDAWRTFDTAWMKQFYARHCDELTMLDPREFEDDNDEAHPKPYMGKKLTPGKYVYNVENLHKALDGIVAGHWTIKEGSDLFNIAPATLQQHKRVAASVNNTMQSKAEKNYQQYRFFDLEQERDLVTRLNKMARAEGGLTKKRYRKEIYGYAKKHAAEAYPRAWDMLDMASSYWTQGFMNKHKDRLCLNWPIKVVKSR